MTAKPVEALTQEEAATELAKLAEVIAAANAAYHGRDMPVMADGDFDGLKQRNAAIEARFPALKRSDSPTDLIGAAVAAHKIRSSLLILNLIIDAPFG